MPKTDFDSAYGRDMEVTNRNIKTLGDRSTFLLGYLVIVVLALASFIFNDSNSLLKPFAWGLFLNYVAMIFAILIWVIRSSFEAVIGQSENLKNQMKANMERYEGLMRRFNFILFYIFGSSAVVSAWLSAFLLA